jgi:lysophospholipase L1-like esterase
MKLNVRTVCVLALVILAHAAQGQQWKFWSEIKNFKRQDSISPPPADPILFVGSSTFRMWPDMQKSFPSHQVINRGFGGSELTDVIYYADDIIFPYRPKQIVIYGGENDIAVTGSAEIAVDRFKYLFKLIRQKLGEVNIVFISIKPCTGREKFIPEVVKANALIRTFLRKQSNTSYVDIYQYMITPKERPIPDMFLSDSIHMNEKGYAIWQREIAPYLVR